MTTPIELAEVVGYSLCLWPPPDHPFNVPHRLEVYETVEEARAKRNEINTLPDGLPSPVQVAVVEVRRAVIE